METISVETLRKNLTVYLKKVEKGNRIAITSHDHQIASLVPFENKIEKDRAALENLRKTAFVGDIVSPFSDDWEMLK